MAGKGCAKWCREGKRDATRLDKNAPAKGDAMLSGGVLGVVAPPLGEGVARNEVRAQGKTFPSKNLRLVCVM